MKSNYTNILLAAMLILAAAVMRIITAEFHLPNITPIAAVGLFSGVVIKDKRYAYLLPLLSLFVADAYFQFFTTIKGFYGIEQILVYTAMALVTFLGSKMGNISTVKVIGYSLIGSLLFFVISNFGSFLKGWYGYDFKGLVTTYTVAIPFFKNTVMSDLGGNIILFGAYFIMQKILTTKVQQA